MIITYKYRIYPTKKQEEFMWQSANIVRWTHNYVTAHILDENVKTLNEDDMRKHFTQLKKDKKYEFLKSISNDSIKDCIRHLYKGWRETKKHPVFWKKNVHTPSFSVRYDSLKRVDERHFKWQKKFGTFEVSEDIPIIPEGEHYIKPTAVYDNKYWYLCFGVEYVNNPIPEDGKVLGIDLGIKNLATISDVNGNSMIYENINKTREVRRLKKKLKRKQRSLSRKYLNAKKNKIELWDCRNYQKIRKEIQLIYRRLTNIRENQMHQITADLVKVKPKTIVMEDLNVKGMMKNRHLSRAIAEQRFRKFKVTMKYKCELYGIEFVQVDKFFPSSRICSACGNKKTDLKLKDRTYSCDVCGNVIDRDINAAINLAKIV